MILKQAQHRFNGLSTDNKNRIKQSCAIFHEMDTNKYYSKPYLGEIPEEYTPMEYLDATCPWTNRAPYIDTDWTFTYPSNTSVECTVAATSTGYSPGFSIGATLTQLLDESSNDQSHFAVGNEDCWWFNYSSDRSISLELNKRMTFIYSPASHKWIYDGTARGAATTLVQETTTLLFGVHLPDGTVAPQYRGAGRIYSFKVSEYGKQIINMVPVIRDSDSKPGMYDTVRNKFFTNANTDANAVEFTYAPLEWYDVTNVINTDWKHVTPDPKLPKTSTILPSEYIECEYVYTDGTALATRAIIDTGYAYEDPDEIRIVSTYKVCTTDTNDGYPAFGVDFFRYGSTRQMHGHMWKNGLYLGQGRVATASSYYLNTKITLDFTFASNKATWVITDHDNNTTETLTYNGNNGWVGSVETDYLGSLHKIPTEANGEETANPTNDDDIYLKGNIYRHIMYHHNEKVRDFVPCIRRSDGIAGMYELVEQKFYRSSFLPKIYGFHVDSTNSDPTTAVTYTDDAVGMTPAAMDFTTGVFNYGDWEDAFFMPRPCMLYSNGTVAYYLDPDDYTKKEDGTASDIANVDFDGNAMMEWGDGKAAIWMSIVADSGSTTSYTVRFANYRPDSTYHAWNFYNKDNELQWHFYTPIYNGSVDSSNKLRSLSGKAISYGRSGEQDISSALSNGSGWYIETWSDRLFIYLLTYLIGKSLNIGTVVGRGYLGSESVPVDTGTLNDKGLFWGSNDSVHTVKVFGMENIWGVQRRRVAGLISHQGKFYYKLTQGTADGSTLSDYPTVHNSGMLDGGSTPADTSSTDDTNSGYLKTMKVVGNTILPCEIGGGTTSYYCSFYYGTTTDTEGYILVGMGGLDDGNFGIRTNYSISQLGALFGTALSYRLPTT